MKTLRDALLALCLASTLTSAPVVADSNSGGFCPFEVPEPEAGRRRFINLGIVQHMDITKDEVKIVYGGGAFGSGYEVRIPLAKPDDAKEVLERMRKAAAQCR